MWSLLTPASQVAQRLKKKNLPGNAGDAQYVGRSLGQEDPLEQEMAHSSILAWRIAWAEEPGGIGRLFICNILTHLPGYY